MTVEKVGAARHMLCGSPCVGPRASLLLATLFVETTVTSEMSR